MNDTVAQILGWAPMAIWVGWDPKYLGKVTYPQFKSHGAKLHQNPRFRVINCFDDLENVSVNGHIFILMYVCSKYLLSKQMVLKINHPRSKIESAWIIRVTFLFLLFVVDFLVSVSATTRSVLKVLFMHACLIKRVWERLKELFHSVHLITMLWYRWFSSHHQDISSSSF